MSATVVAMEARSWSDAAVVYAAVIRRHVAPEYRLALRCFGPNKAPKPTKDRLYEVGSRRRDHQRDDDDRNDDCCHAPVERHDAVKVHDQVRWSRET